MSEQWIQQVQQKMAGYRKSAPEVSWDEIDQVLAASKTHKSRLLWLKRVAAAAALLLIAGVGYWRFLRNDIGQNHPTALSEVRHSQSVIDDKVVVHDSVMKQDEEPKSVVQTRFAQRFNVVEECVIESKDVTSFQSSRSDTVNTSATEEKESSDVVKDKPKSADYPRPVSLPADLHQRKSIENRLTANLYLSNMSNMMRQPDHRESWYNQSCSISDMYPEPYCKPSYEEVVRHRRPVRFGLLLRYRFDELWSVESGLTHTLLSSDITSTYRGVSSVKVQRLRYMGVPLNISHEVWKNRNFGLYVTAGGMIEKCLDASPWQFSLSGAVGVEYKLTDIYCLYAEPGLGYYFPDGSSMSTIYKDSPLHLNLGLGLRFNLK